MYQSEHYGLVESKWAAYTGMHTPTYTHPHSHSRPRSGAGQLMLRTCGRNRALPYSDLMSHAGSNVSAT